jgi:hypothetical protein
MVVRVKRNKKADWLININLRKKEQKKEHKFSTIPDEHKIIKKKKVNEVKDNHYLEKSVVSQKLHNYSKLHYKIQSLKRIPKNKQMVIELTIQLMKLRDDLLIDYRKAGIHVLKNYKFRRIPADVKEDMLSHSIERMCYYGYFYKFDINQSKEGFSWLTTCHYNYFLQIINYYDKHIKIRKGVRVKQIYQLENNNIEMDLEDITTGSLVKGIRYNHADLARDE